MTTTPAKEHTKHIQENGVYMFAKSTQEAILDGYRFDFDSNQGMPSQFGYHFNCVMVLAEDTKEADQYLCNALPPEERSFVEQEYDGVMRKAGRPTKAATKGTK
jgi:hypothetical protein